MRNTGLSENESSDDDFVLDVDHNVPEDNEDNDDYEANEANEDYEDNEDDEDFEIDTMNFNSLFETFFTEPKKNRNVVDVMLEIKRCLETHNRIMLKMYQHMTQSNGGAHSSS